MDASLTIIAEGSSLLSLAAVTLDRYLIVISRKPMSHRTCHLIILGIWVGLSNMVCFVFFYNFEAAGLGHSMLLCVIAVSCSDIVISPNPFPISGGEKVLGQFLPLLSL